MTTHTIQQCQQWASQKLAAAATPLSVIEADILLAFVLHTSISHLRAWPEEIVSEVALKWFQRAIEERCAGKPLAYITEEKEFWSLSFKVTADTLIPRPETELLIELVLSFIPDKTNAVRIADLGTGSGAIAIALASELPTATIIATDQSAAALKIAKFNATQLKFPQIGFHQGSWCDALATETPFDIIVSNPPYLAEVEWPQFAANLQYEPQGALVSGADGLTAIREIISSAANYLKPNGYLLIEHGYEQAAAVRKLMQDSGYTKICSYVDLQGIERVTVGQH